MKTILIRSNDGVIFSLGGIYAVYMRSGVSTVARKHPWCVPMMERMRLVRSLSGAKAGNRMPKEKIPVAHDLKSIVFIYIYYI